MLKFLDKLFGKKPPAAPKVQARPAVRRVTARPPRKRAVDDSPFLKDGYANMELAREGGSEEGNPYATGKWRLDQNDEERKSKAREHGIINLEDAPEDFNPYDTGVFRGAWKD